MVKCGQMNIALNGKSTMRECLREPGSAAESPGGQYPGKVRPGANVLCKVTNESGTAAITASCA